MLYNIHYLKQKKLPVVLTLMHEGFFIGTTASLSQNGA